MATFRHDTDFFSLLMRAENGLVCIRLIGEVDADCERLLTRTTTNLHYLAPRRLFVDLAEVSFAGAALVSFLVRAVDALPPTCTVVLCRPSPRTTRLLRITSSDSIACRFDQLPDAWLEPYTTDRLNSGSRAPGTRPWGLLDMAPDADAVPAWPMNS
ncbi:anti-anti-sigma factor [Asanoa ferruginea]|uniref:Anti-anti-sigma factor n=1 Tax=Asanoa ferruginea TaxID=53367 RepID=A0A3D9ZU17_9ACTN|nr:STAS domain-containing protein [Asanoa ferruginea]REG00887.1 anti-anti-sigma factor [Asanoa ferruginea]GIF47465.1 hypothetical protein Afe04nite_20040 [Asanoa ferruginea]